MIIPHVLYRFISASFYVLELKAFKIICKPQFCNNIQPFSIDSWTHTMVGCYFQQLITMLQYIVVTSHLYYLRLVYLFSRFHALCPQNESLIIISFQDCSILQLINCISCIFYKEKKTALLYFFWSSRESRIKFYKIIKIGFEKKMMD